MQLRDQARFALSRPFGQNDGHPPPRQRAGEREEARTPTAQSADQDHGANGVLDRKLPAVELVAIVRSEGETQEITTRSRRRVLELRGRLRIQCRFTCAVGVERKLTDIE